MIYRVTFKVQASVLVEYEVDAENFQAAAVAAHDLVMSESAVPVNVSIDTLYRETAQFQDATSEPQQPSQVEQPWVVKFYDSFAPDAKEVKVAGFSLLAEAEEAANEVLRNPTGPFGMAKLFQNEQGIHIWLKSVVSPRHGWEVEVLDNAGGVILVESGLTQAQAVERFRHFALSAAAVNLIDFTNRNERTIVKQIR